MVFGRQGPKKIGIGTASEGSRWNALAAGHGVRGLAARHRCNPAGPADRNSFRGQDLLTRAGTY